MKKLILSTLFVAYGCATHADTINNKSSQQQQMGYSYGFLMGRSNADTLSNINLDAFVMGLKQGSTAEKSSLTDEEMAKALLEFKKINEAKQLIKFQKLAAENLRSGQQFLAENAKKAGVVTLPSGLQYQILKNGSGQSPTARSKVTVNYEGRLIDGTIFDSSIARNQPVEFQASQVIQGWTEGLQLMKEGAKYRFFIPAKLAYGEIGSGDAIEPNSTLIFDIELLKIGS
ncbi:MAG: FKBP-type peptidyl-prolyl cis-trans isomerase [Acinetobacter sp.]|nr:FKBP-type peptidyl-prolyl cis-trans isomerase [Acinetobacter sp.]